MTSQALTSRLSSEGPKRILALDGGGIRGLICLGYLARIESLLRHRHENDDLVLSDYFDLIGGTSTGSIVATCLALGWPVERIRQMYIDLGNRAFRPRRQWLGPLALLLGPRFDERPLEKILKDHFGDRRLDSDDLRTGLTIVAKRIDTGSVWNLVNLPDHVYFEHNRGMRLWEVVRASTAAPPFFRPRMFADVGGGEPAAFVDGGMSMHLNPALQMLMVATLDGFSLRWPTGADRLLLCSVGTGSFVNVARRESVRKLNNLQLLTTLISQLLRDASDLNQTMLQWMASSPTAVQIDTQIGALEDDALTPAPLLTYLRYNLELEQPELERIGFACDDRLVRRLRGMSNTENIPQLDEIGSLAATHHVDESHFPAAFNLAPQPAAS